MKNAFVFLLLLTIPIIIIHSKPYQKKVWKLLDKSQKELLTNPGLSVDYTQQAFEILEQTTDSTLISSTLIMCGHAYMLQGSFDLSANTYYDALAYCPSKDNKTRAKIKVSLGTLYGFLKDFSKAIELIDNATSTYKTLNDSSGIANAYNSRGLIHVYMGENEIADKFFKDALRINKALKDNRNIAVNINNMCLYKGNTEEKIGFLKEAIHINKRLNSIWSLAENYNNMGLQLYYASRYDEAINALKEAYAYALEVNSQELICDNYEYSSLVHSAQKNYKEAYESLQNFEQRKNGLLQERRLTNIERKIANQRELNQKKESAIQKQKHQIELLRRNAFIVAILTLCTFLIIFFLVKQYKRKKNLQIAEAQAALLSKDKIITDLKLHQQAIELEIQSKKLESTQKELTNFVLFINSRNELLDKIRDMIKETYKMKPNEIIGHLKKISTFILQFKKKDEESNCLTQDIDDQNKEFLQRLNVKHPNLTSGEKKLATFLRINLSTKEIALLTGISTKAVEMARYRLRKALNIDSKEDIPTYLHNI